MGENRTGQGLLDYQTGSESFDGISCIFSGSTNVCWQFPDPMDIVPAETLTLTDSVRTCLEANADEIGRAHV